MRIAQVAPLDESVPPRLYGGTERIVSFITEELTRRGHAVSLFASGDSITAANLVPQGAAALRLDLGARRSSIAAHLAMLDEVRRQQGRFDIVHCHLSHFQHFPLFETFAAKTLTTPHGRLDYSDLPSTYARWPSFSLSSISMRQRLPLPEARWVGNVYHGLPLDLYPAKDCTPPQDPYLAFLGRIYLDKRPDRAIEIARLSGMRIKIAAKMDYSNRIYCEELADQMKSPHVEFLGEIDEAGKAALFAGAQALLFPIDWPEPFGLAMIEAMAFGVPVIAWSNGSVPEVIDDGITGFVVNSIDEAVAAVKRAGLLDRRKVRRRFEERFSASRMVDDYEAIYEFIAGTRAKATAVMAV
jgi:glycosyltransferase involved in cell wall biosynthesis